MRDFHLPGRSAVFAENGVCATSHPLAAKVAIDTLQAGGNAVDAAIASAVLLGLAEPAMTGLGGDCFALIKPAGTETVVALNGSGRAPAGLSAAALRDAGHTSMPADSVHAVTVPGAVDAFCALHQRYGSMDLEAIFAPAIHYAQEGVPVAPRVAFDWSLASDRLVGNARDFFLLDGRVPTVGDRFRLPKQADLLRQISKQGRAAFYEGGVAREMVECLSSLGGTHTLDDFSQNRPTWHSPISGQYRGLEFLEHPPNGQGLVAILMANILSHFDIADLPAFGAQRAHMEAEAAKLAYDIRNRYLADPDFMGQVPDFHSPTLASDLAALIDPDRAMPDASALTEQVHKDTVYLTVVDRDRMIVSLIYSIFSDFGSGLATPEHGILFHNRGAGFSLLEGHPNEAAGGKRPVHTILPAMIRENGRVTMPFGVMGAAYQPNGHVRFLSNLVDYGMDPQSAIDAPRSFSDIGTFKLERGYDPSVAEKLAAMGHPVSVPETPIGGAQAIRIDWERGVLEGASDPRKDGCALGY